jgi:hypothetical protein
MPILKNGDVTRQSKGFNGPQLGKGMVRQAVNVLPQLPESLIEVGMHIVRIAENRRHGVGASNAIDERERMTAAL